MHSQWLGKRNQETLSKRFLRKELFPLPVMTSCPAYIYFDQQRKNYCRLTKYTFNYGD